MTMSEMTNGVATVTEPKVATGPVYCIPCEPKPCRR